MAEGAPTTELSLADLARLLAPFDLKPRRVRALAQGTINSNFRVDTDGGALFVRVNEGKSEADVRYEAALLWHLGVRRFPTPQPLRRGDGRPFVAHGSKWVSAFPWVAGEVVDGARVTPAHCAAIGGALAALHNAAGDFAERRDGIYTFERIARRIESFRADPRLADVVPLLDEEVSFLRTSRAPSLPSGTIHGDLFPDNALFRGNKLVAVLDFEQASFGRFAYDLAVTLLAWCFQGGDLDGGRARALVDAYRALRPVEPVEREALFAEARLAALRFTVTRITDVFLPGVERAGKDYRDYLARLVRLRSLGRSGLDGLTALDVERDPQKVP
jgi:homoserine kinase type II